MLRNDAEAVPSAVVVKQIRLLGAAAGNAADRAPLRSAPPGCQSDDTTAVLRASARALTSSSAANGAGVTSVGSANGSDGGAAPADEPLSLHVPGAAPLRPTKSEAQRRAGEAGTLAVEDEDDDPVGSRSESIAKPAALRPMASEEQRREGEAGTLAHEVVDADDVRLGLASGSEPAGPGLHQREDSSSGMLHGAGAHSSAEWAGAGLFLYCNRLRQVASVVRVADMLL